MCVKSIHKAIMVKIYLFEVLHIFEFLFSRISWTLRLAPIDLIFFNHVVNTHYVSAAGAVWSRIFSASVTNVSGTINIGRHTYGQAKTV